MNNFGFEHLFGFSLSELRSWKSFVSLMCRPMDPASLGVTRILFGFLMVLDIPQERGLGHADIRFGEDVCFFPFFNFLQPPPLQWTFVMYGIMWMGAFGLMIGFLYRLSCLLFLIPYWYLFLLDKTVWNNHSYLYGLISILFFLCDAHRYCSVDGLWRKKIRNSHVPLWNYTLFRFQVFLVYFYAGLKKIDFDWMFGYSMTNLSKKWVFDPFRLILTDDQIDLYLVHLSGLTLDLTAGFLLFFDKTRPLAFFFVGSFHFMNSQMFSIGMFSYTMLATLLIFCYADWPRSLFCKLPQWVKVVSPLGEVAQTSTCCIYNKEDIKPEDKKKNKEKDTCTPSPKTPPPISPGYNHQLCTLVVMFYIIIQLFLPYSHGLTKGYNNWTNGLYGYSWDMMVHRWNTQHVRITYVKKDTGEVGYLAPDAFSNERHSRWSSHGDMVKQYGTCLAEKLKKYELDNIELYFDVWKSLNHRFQQRMFDPRVNILEAEWHPFKEISYLQPLLVDLSGWRLKLDEIKDQMDNHTEVVFVADFPGLYLENYVQEDLGNTSITVLAGEIVVELADRKENYSLSVNQSMQLPPSEFHNVHTVSDVPSCYMYVFINTTDIEFQKNFTEYEQFVNNTKNCADKCTDVNASLIEKYAKDPYKHLYDEKIAKKEERHQKSQIRMWDRFVRFFKIKYDIFKRSFTLVGGATKSIILQQNFDDFLNDVYEAEKAEYDAQRAQDVVRPEYSTEI